MHFNLFQSEDIWKLCTERADEQKIGENMLAGTDFLENGLKNCPAQFVILGIPEDVGPRANCGKGGSDSAWQAFLSKFLNIQETILLKGSNIILLGSFDFSSLPNYKSRKPEKLRKVVEIIDKAVSDLIETIVKAGKTPIVIGGGHNNFYGLLKGSSKALGKAVNCINLDPHADYRKLEGRHSGNGFSYAKAEGYLNKYSIVGLHENYNSQEMIDRMENDLVDYSTYEAIFLREEIDFEDAIDISLTHVGAEPFGVELDCDAIENIPSSAQTPSGVSTLQARKYIHHSSRFINSIYLHLPEAAPSLQKGSNDQVGKLLCYLASDFIRAKCQ
ncbi:MAG: formimidoylglutamase [Flavobacteriales bacterium]|nr:formimidoylglutamase [Flavobacteriales bacterium]